MRGVIGALVAVVIGGCGPELMGETEAVLDERWGSTELATRALRSIERARIAPGDLSHSAIGLALLATEVTGSKTLQVSGTLYAPRHPGGHWVYAAAPAHSLVYESADGQRIELSFTKVRGDLSSEDAFLAGEHELRFTFDDGREEVAVSSRREGVLTVRTLMGELQLEDLRCATISTELVETTPTRQKSTWGGRLDCGTASFHFDERLTDDLAGYTERKLKDRWDHAGRSYELMDARIQTWRSDGAVIDQRAEGDLMRDGATVGAVDEEMTPSSDGARVSIYLYTENGRVKLGEERIHTRE